ncbi:LysR family transcriptional regulator [Ferrimonas aestuarii]|uniref:LysR family transcriptional regulator n=1 Tax=Ferrimonas aestuarii TaxID=2569539 RepID=A0A4U1BKN7_9GAMM|nr:LysR family transcriptional regulator [Ferrimonas aestuarii]TKB52730.1 LysR family transcriptional regulator [Ferrimonas aestuarii]
MKPSFDDLYLFAQTVIHGGISAAAQSNALQRSKVSRRIQELERMMGCQLLIRTTRTIELTQAGKRLFDLISEPMTQIEQGLSLVQEDQHELSGKLRLAIPAALISSAPVSAIISQYSRLYPDVALEIESRQESVDLRREAFDLQLLPSAEKVMDDSYVQFAILPYFSHFVASPKYLASHPSIESLEQLSCHRILTNRYNAELLDERLTLALRSDDLSLLRILAINGDGVAFIPQVHSKPSIESGELVEVLPELTKPLQQLTLIYPSALFLPKKVKALIELFRQQFQ